MKVRQASWGCCAVAALCALVPFGLGAGDAVRHITLESSTPADGAKLGNVTEVRLVFSGTPLLRGASIRIVDSSRTPVASSAPATEPDDPLQLFTTVDRPLPPGTYVVQWRVIAEDGHVMRDSFRFEAVAE